jgi:membrane protease YdiL (CAAX protease family)
MNGSPRGDSLSASEPTPVSSAPRWRWWIHLLLLSSYVLGVGLLGLKSTGDRAPMLSRSSYGLLISAGVELALFAIVFGLACLASRPSRDDLLLRWRGGFKNVPLGLAYSVALRLALAVVIIAISAGLVASGSMSLESLQEFFRVHQPKTDTIVDFSTVRSDPVYFLLLITLISFVVAGLREELWRTAFLAALRALGPRYFTSLKGQLVAVAIAAVVFGIGHLAMGPLGAFMAGLLGLGLGVIMVLHRSIWPAVIAHGFFDATTFILLRWLPIEQF